MFVSLTFLTGCENEIGKQKTEVEIGKQKTEVPTEAEKQAQRDANNKYINVSWDDYFAELVKEVEDEDKEIYYKRGPRLYGIRWKDDGETTLLSCLGYKDNRFQFESIVFVLDKGTEKVVGYPEHGVNAAKDFGPFVVRHGLDHQGEDYSKSHSIWRDDKIVVYATSKEGIDTWIIDRKSLTVSYDPAPPGYDGKVSNKNYDCKVSDISEINMIYKYQHYSSEYERYMRKQDRKKLEKERQEYNDSIEGNKI